MSRLMPPLKAVRYFEIAAEFESFPRAAEELRVSKGAVSQQIRHLERYLGVSLFRRIGRSVTLTDAGRRYHSAARNAFNILETETERIAGPRVRGQLRMTVLPAFASLWLVPRMPEIQKSMAHSEIVISAEADVVDFTRSDVHIGIRYGGAPQGGAQSTLLGHDELMPVCTARYAESHDIRSADDLSRCVLLHDTYWSDDWSRWLTAAGVADTSGGDGQYFTHYSMAIDTARRRRCRDGTSRSAARHHRPGRAGMSARTHHSFEPALRDRRLRQRGSSGHRAAIPEMACRVIRR